MEEKVAHRTAKESISMAEVFLHWQNSSRVKMRGRSTNIVLLHRTFIYSLILVLCSLAKIVLFAAAKIERAS